MPESELKAILGVVGPMIQPVLLQLWSNTLLPALQAKLVSGSPEIQIVETAFLSFLDQIAKGEIPKI